MDKLDNEKKEILQKFKEAIKDCKLVDSSDEYIVKWLVARNFNLDQAEKMLRNSVEWRRLNKIDEILENFTPPEVLLKYMSMGRSGSDKFGAPVYISAQGRCDLKGMMMSTTRKDFMRFQTWISELINREIRRENEKTGSRNTFITFIMDMDQLAMSQVTYKPVVDARIEQTKIYDAYYPENVRRIFVINAPKIFAIIFNLMKGFLHPLTVEKVRIFSTNRDEWQTAILEEIEADQIPEMYGGILKNPKDGDQAGLFKFNYGGPVPPEYYLNKTTAPEPKDYMETFNIIAGAGGKKKISFKVEQIDSIFRWEFMTEGGDLAYRVYRKDPETGTAEQIIPHSRVESNLYMEEGEIICDIIGKYVLEFDNTYSIVKMKKIRYFVTVEPPMTPTRG